MQYQRLAALLAAVALLTGCSDDGDDGNKGSSGSGASGGSGGSGASGGTGGSDAATAISVTGKVVDASTGTGFAADAYDPVEGVEVCVHEDPSITCATTAADGSYTISGLPAGTLVYLSYKKDGYGSVLYGVMSATDVPTAPQIIIGTLAFEDTLLADAGITRDATKGGALFGAVTLGTPADSQFYMEFGGTGFVYVEGYTIAAEPALTDGPVYAGTDWKLTPALTASTAAGWGLMYGAPGEYTFTITHPTRTCGSVDRKIVAGFSTTYIGVSCGAAQ